MLRQLRTALATVVVLTVLLGFAYPLAVTGISQVAFSKQANGSLLKVNGKVVGSSLIGQNFAGAQYFHPRPSAAGTDGYDPTASASTNLGPSNPKLLDAIAAAATAYRSENGLPADAVVPGDAVTSSASGLDPEISVANARLQASRVAGTRGISEDAVLRAIAKHTDDRSLGFLGDKGVNVLELNLDLDRTR